ncbi:MAG: hypothetical protein K5892_03005, partial [Acholeplasmatales bacterium]|nr:hypothetical protein [Acholeplasmatales bacterium]
ENAKNAYHLRDPYNVLLKIDKIDKIVQFEKNIEELKRNKLSNFLNSFISRAEEFIMKIHDNENLSYDVLDDVSNDAYLELCNKFIKDVLENKLSVNDIENNSIMYNRVDVIEILISYINE